MFLAQVLLVLEILIPINASSCACSTSEVNFVLNLYDLRIKFVLSFKTNSKIKAKNKSKIDILKIFYNLVVTLFIMSNEKNLVLMV